MITNNEHNPIVARVLLLLLLPRPSDAGQTVSAQPLLSCDARASLVLEYIPTDPDFGPAFGNWSLTVAK